MKKFVLSAAALLMTCGALVGCGAGDKPAEQGKLVENGKIGFILPGNDSDELNSFKKNWESLGAEYGVTMVYEKFDGRDPSYYKTCADKLIAAGCNAVICNFEMDGKDAVIETCIDEEIYVGFSGSTVSADVFAEYESNPYFLGQIAPSPETEQQQAYEMTKYFVELYWGANKVDLPAGTKDKLAIWPADFHGLNLEHQMTYRYKGIKQALEEYGVTIKGDEKDDSSDWTVEYTADSILKDKVLIMGNNLGNMDALIQQCTGVFMQTPAAIVTTCMADMLFGKFTPFKALATGTRFGTIDSFGSSYAKWYKADPESPILAHKVTHDPYIAGKYGAINQAIVAVTARAFAQDSIRTADGKAISVSQSYWTVKSLDEYNKANEVSAAHTWKKADFDAIKTEADLQAFYDNATLENLSK